MAKAIKQVTILTELKQLVEKHTGVFHCRQGHQKKDVNFKHIYQEPEQTSYVPDIGDLKPFSSSQKSVLYCVSLYFF